MSRQRRNFLYISAALGLFISMGSALAESSTAQRQNVLFIAVDDLNDWVGYMGGHKQASTPHIDALAKEGVAFMNAYCPAPACGPSRTALMYGIYPHRSGSYGHHDVYHPKKLLPKSRIPLNLAFKNSGYYTAGCGKIFHYGEKRGWDAFENKFEGVEAKVSGLGPSRPLSDWKSGAIDTESDSDTPDGKLTDWAVREIQRDHSKPFFIALGLRKPHLPWTAPKKYFEQYEADKIQLPHVPRNDLSDVPEAGKRFSHSLVGFSDADDHKAILSKEGSWQKLVHAYLATISFADNNVGRVLEALRKSPHWDNTIVVLWGDHGWHLGEKEHWRKMTLWERGTKTPFIIRIPGSKTKGESIVAPVSLQDIYPTLVDLCALKVEQDLDGNSLGPLLADSSSAWDKAVLMSHGPGNFAVREGKWRLIRYADGSEELYDLEKDSGEFVNLARDPDYKDKREELRKHVPKSWRYVMGPRFKSFEDAFSEAKQGDQ